MADNKVDLDDPRGKVISRFKVFWNDPSPKRVVVLRFPNRSQDKPYNARNYLKPTRMRYKPNAKFIEIDVPLDTQLPSYVNMEQAKKFGQILAKNPLIQSGGSYGLAGGFGIGGVSSRSQKSDAAATAAAGSEQVPNKPTEEKDDDVLRHLTLSGKVKVFRPGDFHYAIATFKGDELHLTRVDSVCYLSPHLIHLDAAADNRRSSHVRSAESGVTRPDAQVLNLAMRSINAENGGPEDIGAELRKLQEDKWEHLEWIDEDDGRAYSAFEDHLFYNETGPVERLVSAMSPTTYLDTITGQTTTQRSKKSLADIFGESTDDESSTV